MNISPLLFIPQLTFSVLFFFTLFFFFFFPRISAVPTSMTQVLPSLASLALWPLTWLGTWPMISWHWWVGSEVHQQVLAFFFFFLTPVSSCDFIYLSSLNTTVSSVFSFFPHPRCPTLNPTSERKQCWSCTRCSWSTRSPCDRLSPGSRRNWRTQTQVSGPAFTLLRRKLVLCHLNRYELFSN